MTDSRVYETTFGVRVYEADHSGRITPVSLFNYLQETAGQAARNLGRGRLDLRAKGFAWFLNRFHIEVRRYPRIDEEVRVRTWPYRMDRHASIREFEVVAADGSPLARATSQWVFINMTARRLTRVPDWVREAYPVEDRRMIEDPFLKLSIPEHPDIHLTFHVRLSDLDVNQHANSASYIDWCLETVPERVHRELVPLAFEINYLREAAPRETLSVESEPMPGEGTEGAVFAHQVMRASDGVRLALARSRWGNED